MLSSCISAPVSDGRSAEKAVSAEAVFINPQSFPICFVYDSPELFNRIGIIPPAQAFGSGITVYGYWGTAAEQLARARGYAFIPIQ